MARKRRHRPDNRVLLRAFRLFGTVGFNLAGAMLLGFFGGFFLDRLFASTPWLAITGFLLGAANGFSRLYYLAMQEAKRTSVWEDEGEDG